MSRRIESVPVLPAGGCPASCRPLALVERDRLLGFEAEPAGGPCPWCLEAWREERRPGRPRRPLLPRAGRRLPGGGHEMEEGRPGEAIDRLAGVLGGRAERLLWVEPETLPRQLLTIPHRVARFGVPVHLVRIPHAPWRLARRLAGLVPRESLLSLGEASPGAGDVVLAWSVDSAGGWAREAAWLRAARARGARVVAIGPLAGIHDEGGDTVLRVPPGWEGALALALAATPRAPAPGGWSLRRVAEETGLDEQELERIAGLLADCAGKCFLLPGAPLSVEAETTLAALANLALVRRARLVVSMPPPPLEPVLPGEGRVLGVQPDKTGEILAELPAGRTVVVAAGIDPLAGFPGARELGRFLDAAGLVAVFGPWRGPVARRADLVIAVPGPLSRAGTCWTVAGAWRGRSLSAPPGDVEDELATWRAVGRRLGAPEQLFAPGEEAAEPREPALPASRRDAPALAASWRPDPSLVAGGGLVFLARRVPPGTETGDRAPGVRVAPGTASRRKLREGSLARLRSGDLDVLVRVLLDEALPEDLVAYGAPDLPSRPGPGVLAAPPLVLGAAAPFRGELFPTRSGGQRLTGDNES